MSTFDVTQTPSDHVSMDMVGAIPSEPTLSTLDLLREASSDLVDRGTVQYENARGTIRLTLDANITQKQLNSWNRAALPDTEKAKLRRSKMPDMLKMDAIIMFGQMIADQCVLIEVRRNTREGYRTVCDERTGTALTFADSAVLGIFGSPDRIVAVRKALLNSDPDIIECGNLLQAKSGFGEQDGDEDPLA